MSDTIISLQSITKTFTSKAQSFTALMSVNLDIRSGEFMAIVGKSGSGKSTLLNMITGIDHPSSGTININHTQLSTMNESKLAKWRGENIGIVFQFFQLIPTLTIAENLLLAMEFVGTVPKGERVKRVRELLTQVGIENHANKMPSALSGGEQQRAAIARALANDPKIIVADEPTGNLDSTTSHAIYDLLESLSKSGKTVIVVSHDPNIASRFNRILTMSDGKFLNC
ncbi:MAG: ABC transporter ATP-binding protein [Bacteroidetes bacterium GWF2_41_31]|nr:MAG: ABC transporter ATP-binding protein [Bacteroidetes bacterium GWF2_41_31]OFZ02739.1 MAG: ABC transporter ATP-binding protein [Bacteroidetes bacterium RIFOXYB12_FULL_41_6]